MHKRSEKVLHWWASVTVVIMGLAAVVPSEIMPPTDSLPLAVRFLGGVAGAVAAGFYLRMFFECAFGRNVRHRAAWVMFCLIFPVISTIIYFMTSRSVLYRDSTTGVSQ